MSENIKPAAWSCLVLQADATFKPELSFTEPPAELYSVRKIAALYDESSIEAARQEGEDRVVNKLLCAQANENAANGLVADLRRQLAAAQALLMVISDAVPCMCQEHSEQAEALLDCSGHAALDTLLAARERETIERCIKTCDDGPERQDCNGQWVKDQEACVQALKALLPENKHG